MAPVFAALRRKISKRDEMNNQPYDVRQWAMVVGGYRIRRIIERRDETRCAQ